MCRLLHGSSSQKGEMMVTVAEIVLNQQGTATPTTISDVLICLAIVVFVLLLFRYQHWHKAALLRGLKGMKH